MKTTKKIVIAGASVYGLDNLSDDAMFAVFCRELHENMPDLEITLLARHPSKELDNFYKVKSIQNLDHQTKEESIGRWFNGLNPKDDTDHLKKIYNCLKECDLLIIGGEPFIDISLGVYRGPAPYAMLLITLAKFLGKPVMINGIHMGRALKTDIGIEITRFCIRNADLVTIREEETRPFLHKMGIEDTKHIVTLSDASYGLNVANPNRGLKILKSEGIKFKSKNVIGVTFRHMYWRWDKKTWDKYSDTVARLCEYMIEKFNADILFIPHNTYLKGQKYESDIPAHQDIATKIKFQDRVHQIKTRYNIYDTLSIFPHLSMVFGNRRHTLIFGAIHKISGLGVGEKLHVRVTMKELGIGGNLFVDIEDFNYNTIKDNIDYVWKNKEKIGIEEGENLPDLRARALKHAKLASQLIENGDKK